MVGGLVGGGGWFVCKDHFGWHWLLWCFPLVGGDISTAYTWYQYSLQFQTVPVLDLIMHPDLILPKSAQNYNKSINHKFEFTKIKPIYHCSFICSLVIHIGKKKLKKYFFFSVYLLFVFAFLRIIMFFMAVGCTKPQRTPQWTNNKFYNPSNISSIHL